jgi:hypothetical protein
MQGCRRFVRGWIEEREFFTNVRIRLVVERIFRIRDFVGVVALSVVCDVLRRLLELLERLIKDIVVVLGNVEFDLDVPNNLHISKRG